ncbi:MAG TPA: hypothetical protein VGJ02_07610 [Pyrinomonadaceae bacterium]
MNRTVWILTFLLSVCACVVAQEKPKSECPTILVTGPSGIIKKGEIAFYTANIGATKQNYNLEFIWRNESGTIVTGQGTTRIGIANVERAQTVTLDIKGLPLGCPNTVSEFGSWCPAPQAEKLDQFSQPPDQIDKVRIEGIATTLSNNPNAQLYIFAPADVRVRMAVADRLSKAIPERGIDVSRMTFVASGSKNSIIQFWLVPPGATPPAECEGCELPESVVPAAPAPANCPTLEVTGPSGITPAGGIMPFVVLISDPKLRKLTFEWRVNAGNIVEGQGSRVVKVRAPAGRSTITANVRVGGLPQGCHDTASASVQ